MALFQKFREGLSKTRDKLFADIKRAVLRAPALDEAALEELEAALIATDMGVETATQIINDIRAALSEDRQLHGAGVLNIAKQEIVKALTATPRGRIAEIGHGRTRTTPVVVLMIGVNGTGKTTSAAKLAHHLKSRGHRVLLAACDTFRAAAIDQLKVWGERAGVDVISGQHGADAAAVAFDALEAATKRGVDYLVIDTAGRLHTKKNLMEEMKKMQRVLQKRVSDAPHEVLLVLDGATGQNALNQAREFHSALGVTGLIVTKLDGTAKGGIVIAISRELSIPVRFLGVGEQLEDLQPFDPEAFAEALFTE